MFKAQAQGDLQNAILLLDEPGLSLHALKQQEFRKTVSRIAEDNQVVYTTRSPFLVGTDELNLVRIVEMTSREVGTQLHTRLVVDDAGKGLRTNVALVPASSASKVVYYATLLTTQRLKAAALLDSDRAGDNAAKQDELVRLLAGKKLLLPRRRKTTRWGRRFGVRPTRCGWLWR